jgi:hypothetical protein
MVQVRRNVQPRKTLSVSVIRSVAQWPSATRPKLKIGVMSGAATIRSESADTLTTLKVRLFRERYVNLCEAHLARKDGYSVTLRLR